MLRLRWVFLARLPRPPRQKRRLREDAAAFLNLPDTFAPLSWQRTLFKRMFNSLGSKALILGSALSRVRLQRQMERASPLCSRGLRRHREERQPRGTPFFKADLSASGAPTPLPRSRSSAQKRRLVRAPAQPSVTINCDFAVLPAALRAAAPLKGCAADSFFLFQAC